MWVFTPLGFFSTVCEKTNGGMADADRMLVRSRDRRHLENLTARFNLSCSIRDNEGALHDVWSVMLSRGAQA
jgi:hypothetical protein